MKTKSFASGRSLIPLLLLLSLPLLLLPLTGCISASSVPKESLPASSVLYQPPTLRLKAGLPIQTKDGTYTPQVDEIWHSDARYQAAEQESQDLAEANRKTHAN